jgi:hypothetical protein
VSAGSQTSPHWTHAGVIATGSRERRQGLSRGLAICQPWNKEDMTADDEARALRLATNESVCRRSNERLSRAAASYRFDPAARVPFICECADPGCRETVLLSAERYERVRAYPDRFFLVAGHEDAELQHERIVQAEDGYAIVEKVGAAGAEALRLDPRAGSRLVS